MVGDRSRYSYTDDIYRNSSESDSLTPIKHSNADLECTSVNFVCVSLTERHFVVVILQTLKYFLILCMQ